MTRIWHWLHLHGIHWLCRRESRPNYREFIVGLSGDDPVDITNQAAVRQIVHVYRRRLTP